MNLSENQIEALLRGAPAPKVPADLEHRVRLEIALPRTGQPVGRGVVRTADPKPAPCRGWRRWWPAVLPAIATAGLATALLLDQREKQALVAELAASSQASSAVAGEAGASPTGNALSAGEERADLERLRALVKSLSTELAGLDSVRQDNDRLLAALAALQTHLPPEVKDAEAVSERAQSIQCVNNLKQLGLAVRVWATDNEDQFPPDVLSMTNEIVTPKVLVCPADDLRHPAADWASYTAANCSYEFLSPGPGRHEIEPTRVLWRCSFHGNVGLCDGSVQMGVAKSHPERFETLNGVLYMVRDPQPTEGTEGVPDGPPPAAGGDLPSAVVRSTQDGKQGTFRMDPELMKRYGLAAPAGGGAEVPATNDAPGATPRSP